MHLMNMRVNVYTLEFYRTNPMMSNSYMMNIYWYLTYYIIDYPFVILMCVD